MKIKPRKNRIVLKLLEKKSETKGGIILPENIKETDQFGFIDRGEIMAMGPDVDGKDFKIGDNVIFKKTEALQVTLSGKDTKDGREEMYILIQDNFITCKII